MDLRWYFCILFPIDNAICDEAMKYLSESLKSNNSIQTLELWRKLNKNKK